MRPRRVHLAARPRPPAAEPSPGPVELSAGPTRFEKVRSTTMPAIRHRTIEIDGRHVFVREAGDPHRPTLVLLPGYPSSTRAYVRLIDRLAPNWHAVAIDYPGFGLSDPL